jgi:hypothetical protein
MGIMVTTMQEHLPRGNGVPGVPPISMHLFSVIKKMEAKEDLVLIVPKVTNFVIPNICNLTSLQTCNFLLTFYGSFTTILSQLFFKETCKILNEEHKYSCKFGRINF